MEQDIITGVRFLVSSTMIAIAFILVFYHRDKERSRVYNRSRNLLILACLCVGTQTLIQFFLHLREQSPSLCWALNQTLYIPAILCFNLAEHNLLRAGHRMKWFYFRAIGCFVITHSLLLAGLLTGTLIDDAQPWHTMNFVVAVLFFCIKIWLAISLYCNLRQTVSFLSDQELENSHRALKYTATSMYWLIFVSMAAPWLGVTQSLVLSSLYGMFILALMYWYLYRFIRYGDNMQEVVQVSDEIEEATLIEEQPVTEVPNDICLVVEQWVAEKHYTDPDLTVAKALQQMGISATALNFYLEHNTQVGNYRQWLPCLRIEEAKRLMRENPNYTQQAIAEACGYTSQSTLSRTFKAVTGITTKEWQNEISN